MPRSHAAQVRAAFEAVSANGKPAWNYDGRQLQAIGKPVNLANGVKALQDLGYVLETSRKGSIYTVDTWKHPVPHGPHGFTRYFQIMHNAIEVLVDTTPVNQGK